METRGQMGPCKEAATGTGTGIRPGQPPHTSQAPGPEREVTQEQSQPWRVTAGCCVCRGFATPPSLPPSLRSFGHSVWECRRQLRWLHHSG